MIDSWDNLLIAIRYFSEHPEYFGMLMNIALDDQLKNSWRVAWMADKIHDNHPSLVEPYIDRMIDFLQHTANGSKKRQFLKLISLHPIPEDKTGLMLDYCLKHFTDSIEPIAVRVYAMQVLYNISETEPEFKPELICLIEHEIEYHSSAGIRSRGGKLLTKLYKQTNKLG